MIDMHEEIKKRSVERLKHEKKDKDPELLEEKSYFFNKLEEYAMKLFAYYECFKCKHPYYGGLHNCEQEMQEIEANGNEEGQKVDFKREELLCLQCSNYGKDVRTCALHKDDYIEWKCRYCCTIARWYCHGTTHYCEYCHNKWQEQQKLALEGKLVQCTPETCKLKNNHAKHGDEFAMGCGMCKQISETA